VERHCPRGQSPSRVVAPVKKKKKRRRNTDKDTSSVIQDDNIMLN
jgi:hypothetical protein